MAVTNEASNLVLNIEATPPRFNEKSRSKSDAYYEEFDFTQSAAAGDANSTIRLCKVPANARVDLMLSWVQWSAFGTGRVLSCGYEAHTKVDGTAVTAAPAAFTAGLDVSVVGANFIGMSPTRTLLTRTMEGEAFLAFQCTGGTIPAGATVKGAIAWRQG